MAVQKDKHSYPYYQTPNDMPLTPCTTTPQPTGLLSPSPSDSPSNHNNDPSKPPRPREHHFLPTKGPSVTEILTRLDRLEQEQHRNGTVFKLRWDDDEEDWLATPDPHAQLTPIVPSSPALPPTKAERIFLEALPEPTDPQRQPPLPSDSDTRKRKSEYSSPERKKPRRSGGSLVTVPSLTHDESREMVEVSRSASRKPPGLLARDIGHAVRRRSKRPTRNTRAPKATSGDEGVQPSDVAEVKDKEVDQTPSYEVVQNGENGDLLETSPGLAQQDSESVIQYGQQNIPSVTTQETKHIAKISHPERERRQRAKHQTSGNKHARTKSSKSFQNTTKNVPDPLLESDEEPPAATPTIQSRRETYRWKQSGYSGITKSQSTSNTQKRASDRKKKPKQATKDEPYKPPEPETDSRSDPFTRLFLMETGFELTAQGKADRKSRENNGWHDWEEHLQTMILIRNSREALKQLNKETEEECRRKKAAEAQNRTSQSVYSPWDDSGLSE
ncbi:MAG: hypothetical protein HETSPECPRED_005803 [Heterodermia speciosa]|uniref:Uncharacterized protein n=1 Tax=Heterodermia speciosa TaxID=116794 RepID=A0A8H3ILI1_9LECA|nr:MAG: hypothetical protein HETSPECPRED_005803 [Heterodermia speciosa]